jgi:hypothetical protein
MSEVVTSDAADAKPAVENKPMTDQDFLSSRIAKRAKVKAEVTPEAAPKEEVPKDEAPSKEGDPQPKEPSPKEVLSKDIDELTDEEIAELAQKGKSGLLKRIAELTAKRKLAEEKAAALEASIAQAKQQIPEPKVENNPYSNVKDLSELQGKRKEVDEVIEWAEEVLFRAEDLSATDVAATVDGKEYTKADIRDSLRKARKARDKFIPAQFNELQASEQRKQLEGSFKQQARKELGWLDGEDNDTRKRYEAMVNDPRLIRVKEAVPEIAPQIEYLIAHAANSMYGRRVIEPTTSKSPSLNPPSNPSTNASVSERVDSRVEKSLKEVEARFKQTGSSNDFIALRAAQISKRKT